MLTRLYHILWPSFLGAGALEALVFALIDPGDLHLMGRHGAALSDNTIYSLAFLLFWVVVGAAVAMALYLAFPPPGSATAAEMRQASR